MGKRGRAGGRGEREGGRRGREGEEGRGGKRGERGRVNYGGNDFMYVERYVKEKRVRKVYMEVYTTLMYITKLKTRLNIHNIHTIPNIA